jgi:hypothetical protein
MNQDDWPREADPSARRANSPMTDQAGSPPSPKRRVSVPLAVAMVVIGLIAAAALVIALLEFFESDPKPTTTQPTQMFRGSSIPVDVPTLVPEDELREFGRDYPPVYWAGPREDAQYELTATQTGNIFIRYLPEDVEVGDASEHLTVATYPVAGGYQLLVESSTTEGANAVHAESGALVVTNDNDDQRAYFAFEGSDFQVEVFDPAPGVAAGLVLDGSLVLLQ